jgi:hypothetical protein
MNQIVGRNSRKLISNPVAGVPEAPLARLTEAYASSSLGVDAEAGKDVWL